MRDNELRQFHHVAKNSVAIFLFLILLTHYVLTKKHQISFFKILCCNKNVLKSPNTFRLVSTFSKITLDV